MAQVEQQFGIKIQRLWVDSMVTNVKNTLGLDVIRIPEQLEQLKREHMIRLCIGVIVYYMSFFILIILQWKMKLFVISLLKAIRGEHSGKIGSS